MYRAKSAYLDEKVVSEYDKKRFTSLKGRITHFIELRGLLICLNIAGVTEGSRILDCPCGTGRISRELVCRGYFVMGVDISPAMVAYANRLKSPRFQAQVMDAEQLEFPTQSFDAVVCLRLMGHLPPPSRRNVLMGFARVAPVLIAAFYDPYSWNARFRASRRPAGSWFPVSVEDAKRELICHGYDILHVHRTLGSLAETYYIVARSLPQ